MQGQMSPANGIGHYVESGAAPPMTHSEHATSLNMMGLVTHMSSGSASFAGAHPFGANGGVIAPPSASSSPSHLTPAMPTWLDADQGPNPVRSISSTSTAQLRYSATNLFGATSPCAGQQDLLDEQSIEGVHVSKLPAVAATNRVRNKAVICRPYFSRLGCAYKNDDCPFLHVTTLDDPLPLPQTICAHVATGCLRGNCKYFHGTQDHLNALIAQRGARGGKYHLSELNLPIRDPPIRTFNSQPPSRSNSGVQARTSPNPFAPGAADVMMMPNAFTPKQEPSVSFVPQQSFSNPPTYSVPTSFQSQVPTMAFAPYVPQQMMMPSSTPQQSHQAMMFVPVPVQLMPYQHQVSFQQ